MNQKPTFNPLADPDLADAILLAMLDNPHHADAIATLSDEDLARIAAETP